MSSGLIGLVGIHRESQQERESQFESMNEGCHPSGN
jgi:hypothetical protein